MPHRYELFGKVGHDTFGSAVEPGRDTLIKRCDLSDFQWTSPFYCFYCKSRKLLARRVCISLGLRLASASELPVVICELIDVTIAQPQNEEGLKGLKIPALTVASGQRPQRARVCHHHSA